MAEVPWPKGLVEAKLEWPDGEPTGYLHFFGPDGERAAVAVTRGPDGNDGSRNIWHVEDDGTIATVTPSIHYVGKWHSPKPVRFRLVDELAPPGTVTITAHERSYRIVNPGGRVGSKLAQGIPYEHKLLGDVFERGLSGTAFDVGSHVGNHALYLGAVCGLKVHAWEPHAPTLRRLEGNVALNPELDITVHSWGAGEADAVGKFTSGRWIEFDPSRDGATIHLDRGDVPVHAIDDRLDVEDLVVVKIDVEGMEAPALAGMRRHLTRSGPVVYAETHRKTDDEKIGAVLEPLGYERSGRIEMGSVMVVWERPR